MAPRPPFWKWRLWKSICFCPWPPSTCIWNLKLKFQSKLDLCSGKHVVYRRTDGRADRRTRWFQYTPPRPHPPTPPDFSIPPPPPPHIVSNHQHHDCLLNRLFRRRSKKTSKLRVTGLCAGTGEFPAQMASNAENVSIWWRHHADSHPDDLSVSVYKFHLIKLTLANCQQIKERW